jgi:hypothetical protein
MDAGNRKGFVEKRREEYRKFLRFPLSLEAECLYNVGQKAEHCRIVDISNHGLGLEFDIPIRIQGGQLMMLEINIADKKPLSAITKLAWVRSQEDGFMTQRVGSHLLFIDPKGKEQLMEHAHAGLLSNISRNGRNSPG